MNPLWQRAPHARGRRLSVPVLAALLALGIAGSVAAEAYKYVDEHGSVHFTEDPGMIPPKYRDQVETRDMPVRVSTSSSAPESRAGGSFSEQLFGTQVDPALERKLNFLLVATIALVLIQAVIGLGMTIHALINGEIFWGLGHFFVGLTVPFYIFMKLEQSAIVKLGLVMLWTSPFVVGIWFLAALLGASGTAG